MRNGFLWSSLFLFAFTLVFIQQAPSADQKAWKKKQRTEPEFVPGELIVKLKKSNTIKINAMHSVMTALGANHPVNVQRLKSNSDFVKVQFKDNTPMAQLVQETQNLEAVEYADPNWIYHVVGDVNAVKPKNEAIVPNDPFFSQTWGLYNVGQKDGNGQEGVYGVDVGATTAWTKGTGTHDVVVAVIDTGVDYNHEDLKNNIFINANEVAGNGKDDDGNGFIDDVRGWNFSGKTNDPMDDNRHGTHCAGTIAAEGNNAIGVAGVAWKTRILPVKFMSALGRGSLEEALESVRYATKMGARVMSNSWGGGGYAQSLYDAIKEAREKGILFVAAAGNESENNDDHPAYPAGYKVDNVISVAATDNRDRLATFSNYGKKSVHLSAPGVSIYSTLPNNRYGFLSGTSMATPQVAGAASLLWSMHMNWTFADIKKRLLTTAEPVRGLKNKTITGGRLNVNNAVENYVPEKREPNPALWKPVAKKIENEHPYKISRREIFELSHRGAKYLRLRFSQISVEKGFDFVSVYDQRGQLVEEITGDWTNYVSDYVEGSKLTIVLEADHSDEGFGFVVDRYDYID